jgi:hypothetical protein
MEEYLKRSMAFQKRRAALGSEGEKLDRILFFRMMGPIMQARLEKIIDLRLVPRVLIHGNPHLDNYVHTFRGSALLDFDRSRMGPYCWDVIRFLASLSLRREEDEGFLNRSVVDYFIDGYYTHFMRPDIPFKQIRLLKNAKPEKWQTNTRAYLASNRKWAGKMRQFPLDRRSDFTRTLLKRFLASRNELHLLDEFYVDEVGATPGTLGKKHFIYSLLPKNPDALHDAILLDLKEVYIERDTRFFNSPWAHHGVRMIEASKVYADGMEQRLGYATMGDKQFWGRQIPSFATKVKKFLNVDEQRDVAYSIGSQLGKGHRKSITEPKIADVLMQDFQENFDKYYKVARLLNYELRLSYKFVQAKENLYRAYRQW